MVCSQILKPLVSRSCLVFLGTKDDDDSYRNSPCHPRHRRGRNSLGCTPPPQGWCRSLPQSPRAWVVSSRCWRPQLTNWIGKLPDQNVLFTKKVGLPWIRRPVSPFFVFGRILVIIKIILEDISVLGTHELVDYWGLADLPATKKDDPEGFLLVPGRVAGEVGPRLAGNSDLHTVGGPPSLDLLVAVVSPPEGVPPVDDLVVGGQELSGDLHVVDGETVGPATALLMINKCQVEENVWASSCPPLSVGADSKVIWNIISLRVRLTPSHSSDLDNYFKITAKYIWKTIIKISAKTLSRLPITTSAK